MKIKTSAIILASLFIFQACDSCSSNTKPTANAGTTQNVNAAAAVTLDGSRSTDQEGNTLIYAWTQTSGTAVQLSDATAVQPTFTATGTPDTLIFQLIVSDGWASSDPASVTINVWMDVDKRIFVNAAANMAAVSAGLAKADGSMANPYTTIGSAIAAATNGEDVYVATDIYLENITMVEGVSIFGGYEAATWTRNITTNETTISPSAADTPTITAGSGITNATYVNGFTITGPAYTDDTKVAYTVHINAGAPTISSDTISGGSHTSNAVDAIYCNGDSVSPIISGNTITIGTPGAVGISYAMAINLDGCTGVDISGNTLSGSSDPSYVASYGVQMIFVGNSSTATIQQNIIDAGKNTSSQVEQGFGTIGVNIGTSSSATVARNLINGGDGITPGTFGSVGIFIVGNTSGTTIENNIIFAGDGYSTNTENGIDSVAVGAIGDGSADIINNTIYLGGNTTSSGLREGIASYSEGILNVVNNLVIEHSDVIIATQICLVNLDTRYNSVLNNDCKPDASSKIFAYQPKHGDLTPYTSVAAMEIELVAEGTSAANVGGNKAVDPALQTGSDYLLSAGSPMIGAGYSTTPGGVVTLPTVDYDGNARPTAATGLYDIGADEYYASE